MLVLLEVSHDTVVRRQIDGLSWVVSLTCLELRQGW